ncbi:MAG TPA: hypothetical protein PKH24_05265 [Sedimentisphaerales bacterium]|nr:hypothetical protein [Sedimentisphaerales bacterium]HNU29042.1 hypothetical protein [Sedimentisphaerales bacterium]
MSTRKTTADNWGPLANLGSVVNSSTDEILPTVSADGLELYFPGYWTNARSEQVAVNSRGATWRANHIGF